MSQITRTWLGFAAIGAGLIHLAMVVSSPLPVAIVLVGLGVTEIGWGILAFANGRAGWRKTRSLSGKSHSLSPTRRSASSAA